VLRQNTEPGAVGTAGIVLMTFRDLRNVPSVGASVARGRAQRRTDAALEQP
jgi:hypothetical protein